MLTKCCLCISLRTATLTLATLGALSYMTNAYQFSQLAGQFSFFYSAVSTYYVGATFACIAGIIGVIKNKQNYVKIYSFFYWWQVLLGFTLSIVFSIVAFYLDKDICEKLIEQPDIDMDMDTCIDWYIRTASTMVICLGIMCLIDLHFCMAVWAYYQQLKAEHQNDFLSDPGSVIYYTSVPAYTTSQPPAYGSVPHLDAKASSANSNVQNDAKQ